MLHAYSHRAATSLQLALILAVSAWVFLPDLGRHPFIGTEGLRAIVVKEMLERPGFTLPTVHHVPYLRKPPLYAWTTVALARAMNRLDEFVCRLPSAISAVLLVALTYIVGERRLGGGAGFAAATFLLANVTVLDYGVRAELDMPFALLCAVSALLTSAAFNGRGAAAGFAWIGAYAAALVAALWKGPHVLIFNALALLVLARRHRRWDWLWHPAQLAGLIGTLAALITWTVVLSRFGGASDVGRTAVGELFLRLVPHGADDLLGIIAFPVVTLIAALPASVFILSDVADHRAGPNFAIAPSVTGGFPVSTRFRRFHGLAAGVTRAARQVFRAGRSWSHELARDPFTEFLLVYTLVNLVFLWIAPAKAPRYTLPLFWAMALLGGQAVVDRANQGVGAGESAARSVTTVWLGIARFVFGAGVAALGLVLFATVLGAKYIGPLPLAPAWPWWLAGGAGMAFGAWEWLRRPRAGAGAGAGAAAPRLVGLLLVVAACRPLMVSVWWPARLASDSAVDPARRIDELVPPGAVVHVYKRDDAPDVAFYSRRYFQWTRNLAETKLPEGGDVAMYYLVRADDLDELADPQRRSEYQELFRFMRNDRDMIFFEVSGSAPTTGTVIDAPRLP